MELKSCLFDDAVQVLVTLQEKSKVRWAFRKFKFLLHQEFRIEALKRMAQTVSISLQVKLSLKKGLKGVLNDNFRPFSFELNKK